jgi:hypothetical protein
MKLPGLLDSPAVFPSPDGGVLWVPAKLPVHVPEHAMTMTVEEWLLSTVRP